MESMTDAQLAVLSQGGSREAFTLLARRWEPRLQRFLCRTLGNEDDAHDTCQEALLRAFVGIRTLRQPEHVGTWLHQIAINLARDRGRRRGGLRMVELDEAAAAEWPDRSASPHEDAERSEKAALVRRVLARLPEEQRTAIVLREMEGFNASEVAAMTGVPAATVRSRIFYGFKALRRLVGEHAAAVSPAAEGRAS